MKADNCNYDKSWLLQVEFILNKLVVNDLKTEVPKNNPVMKETKKIKRLPMYSGLAVQNYSNDSKHVYMYLKKFTLVVVLLNPRDV